MLGMVGVGGEHGALRIRPDDQDSGLRSLKYRPIPEIEPPVPTETTIASTSPPVCSQSSGPVVS